VVIGVKGSASFFEKKKQKTFCPLRAGESAKRNKSSLVISFKKELLF
jgi:hypothetical protein